MMRRLNFAGSKCWLAPPLFFSPFNRDLFRCCLPPLSNLTLPYIRRIIYTRTYHAWQEQEEQQPQGPPPFVPSAREPSSGCRRGMCSPSCYVSVTHSIILQSPSVKNGGSEAPSPRKVSAHSPYFLTRPLPYLKARYKPVLVPYISVPRLSQATKKKYIGGGDSDPEADVPKVSSYYGVTVGHTAHRHIKPPADQDLEEPPEARFESGQRWVCPLLLGIQYSIPFVALFRSHLPNRRAF
jgi:hypothetical protein